MILQFTQKKSFPLLRQHAHQRVLQQVRSAQSAVKFSLNRQLFLRRHTQKTSFLRLSQHVQKQVLQKVRSAQFAAQSSLNSRQQIRKLTQWAIGLQIQSLPVARKAQSTEIVKSVVTRKQRLLLPQVYTISTQILSLRQAHSPSTITGALLVTCVV